jgi:hypothetical protein
MPDENPQCHIHDQVGEWEVDDIRENVCVKVSDHHFSKHTDGKYYCVFHLPPTEEKDAKTFEKIFRARLNSVEEKLATIEKLPEEERREAREKISYDFRYVRFPAVYLSGYKFEAWANFRSATFSADAYFSLATFSAYADFSSATFSARASFGSATFSADADFMSATFLADANFENTKFFAKNGSISFYKTNFAGDTFFDRTKFGNEVSFESAIFGTESYVIFRRAFFAGKVDFRYCCAEGYLIFSNPRQSRKSSFELQHAVFEKASRISFHTVDLRPSWFVNIDSRKFVFTDIFWINRDWDFWNRNINRELESLEERGIKDQKRRLFEIAARQLAVNAEENNRYEDAAEFRYMAMETRRLEETKKLSFSRFITWLYKWTSGYGESWTRAALVLLVLILFFGVLYASPLSLFDYGSDQFRWMYKGEGLVHSLSVAAFQRPEPKAADSWTKFFIILETIFAPLQAALLALAIRRKFMR